jgi:hypothetical protein
MLQGIVDTYIMPPIANAASLSLGLDLAGPALDAGHPALAGLPALAPLLVWSGRGAVGLPAAGNRDGTTAVVVQHPEDGVEDGHEIAFQTEGPKHQVRCFLETLAPGPPRVPVGAGPLDPCP